MAQGNMKKKVQVPGGSKKQKHQKKQGGLKKGGRTIAPKKAKKIEEAKMKKNFQKALATNIEDQVRQKAGGLEAKPFHIVKSSDSASASKKKSK